jgi:hypothetical protein
MLRLTTTWWCCQLALDDVLDELVYVSARNFSVPSHCFLLCSCRALTWVPILSIHTVAGTER